MIILYIVTFIFIFLLFCGTVITEHYVPWQYYHKQKQWELKNNKISLVYLIEHPSRNKYLKRDKWWKVWKN